MRDVEDQVKPYVTIAAQKGAIPGTKVGTDYHHEEVSNFMLFVTMLTIVLAIMCWVCVKVKEIRSSKQDQANKRDQILKDVSDDQTLLADESFVSVNNDDESARFV